MSEIPLRNRFRCSMFVMADVLAHSGIRLKTGIAQRILNFTFQNSEERMSLITRYWTSMQSNVTPSLFGTQ